MNKLPFDPALVNVCRHNYLAVLITSFCKHMFVENPSWFPYWVYPSTHTMYREGMSWCETFGADEREARKALAICSSKVVGKTKDVFAPVMWRYSKQYHYVEYKFNPLILAKAERTYEEQIAYLRKRSIEKHMNREAMVVVQPALKGFESAIAPGDIANLYMDDGRRFKVAVESATGYVWGKKCAESAARNISRMVSDGIPIQEIRETIGNLAECDAREQFFPSITKPDEFRAKFRQIQRACKVQISARNSAGEKIKPSFVKIDINNI